MSKLDDLERLNKLKENNTISDEEFKHEKQKLLNVTDNEKFTKKGIVRLDIIGFVLSVYASTLVIISFYIHLGIFQLDILIAGIFVVVSLLVNIKVKKQITDKNMFVIFGMGFSVLAIILLVPSICNLITYFNLYV